MKNPFQYQPCEWSCVPQTFINGISFLLHRHEVDSKIIQNIWSYSLDAVSKKGEFDCREGTTAFASYILANMIDSHRIELEVNYYEGEDVDRNTLEKVLGSGGCVLFSVKSKWKNYHYILITGEKGNEFLCWDAYHRTKLKWSPNYRMPSKEKPDHNLLIEKSYLFSGAGTRFASGKDPGDWEMVTMVRSKSKK